MSRSTADRLRDILQSAELAGQHAAGLDAQALAAAPGPRDAALFRLAIVCEAASRLAVDVQALAPEIEWRKIRSMRNLLIHSYWQIDVAIVVGTIAIDLPRLRTETLRLLDLVERSRP